MNNLFLVFLGGGFGALSRYGITLAMNQWLGQTFPYGTLMANLLGCILFGVIIGVIDAGTDLSTSMRLLLLTGFLGALTTFSTFEYELFSFGKDGFALKALLYLSISVIVGYLLLWGGHSLGKGYVYKVLG